MHPIFPVWLYQYHGPSHHTSESAPQWANDLVVFLMVCVVLVSIGALSRGPWGDPR